MSKYLCTFSGKYGDILWSLATAKQISEIVDSPVDFAVMPYYVSLLPLLVAQDYIGNAFVIENWLRTHSNHGDQPWEPPNPVVPWEYDQVWHLTYRGHPGISAPRMPLIDFIAYQQGVQFRHNPIPFIDAPGFAEGELDVIHTNSGPLLDVVMKGKLITYAFNEQYDQLKKEFFEDLWTRTHNDFEFLNVGDMKWTAAACVISRAICHLGCRSANWVLATGIGQDTITYEPHPARHAKGHLGAVFGCPYDHAGHYQEQALPAMNLPAKVCAGAAAFMIRQLASEKIKQQVLERTINRMAEDHGKNVTTNMADILEKNK